MPRRPPPERVEAGEVMGVADGYGPLFHRRYRTEIRDAMLSPDELFARLTANLNRAAPIRFARFQRLLGDKGTMAVGDEYVDGQGDPVARCAPSTTSTPPWRGATCCSSCGR
ncbi:MAG: hypothetical protein ACRDNK_16205 [Solirubrobacteraceae bacterium]